MTDTTCSLPEVFRPSLNRNTVGVGSVSLRREDRIKRGGGEFMVQLEVSSLSRGWRRLPKDLTGCPLTGLGIVIVNINKGKDFSTMACDLENEEAAYRLISQLSV